MVSTRPLLAPPSKVERLAGFCFLQDDSTIIVIYQTNIFAFWVEFEQAEKEVNPKAYPLAGPELTVTILDIVQQASLSEFRRVFT